jgi:hypothetical protein
VLPHPGQVPGGHHRIRRQPVHLWLVEEQGDGRKDRCLAGNLGADGAEDA